MNKPLELARPTMVVTAMKAAKAWVKEAKMWEAANETVVAVAISEFILNEEGLTQFPIRAGRDT